MHIGLEQLYYSTVEGQGSVEVCIAVLSGDITGNTFIISYTTIDGLAEGTYKNPLSFSTFSELGIYISKI